MKLTYFLLATTSCVVFAAPASAQNRSNAIEICKGAVVARGLGNNGFDDVDASKSGGDSWRVTGYAKSVDRGRASFNCRLDGTRVVDLSVDEARGDTNRSRDNDRRRGDRQADFERSVLCESTDRQRNTCQMSTRGGVRLVKQTSDTGCRQGKNWGYTAGSVWVDKGCSGQFETAGKR